MKKDFLIIVRGAGDLATGTIHKLWKAGFKVVALESENPSSIRRQVSASEAVYEGKACVEGMHVLLVKNIQEMEEAFLLNQVPLFVDPFGKMIEKLKPDVLVDAILAKKNLGTKKDMAPLTIALGPGFVAGKDVDFVIETKRGHNLGRVIKEGQAIKNTGVPGNIGGYTKERVIHAPVEGTVHIVKNIGDIVRAGETIAKIDEYEVPASLSGILRGMIRNGYVVTPGFKMADIDPRLDELDNCFTISDKARCIAGSVLEVICGEIFNGKNIRKNFRIFEK